MQRFCLILIVPFLISGFPLHAADLNPKNTKIYFSPAGGCTDAIIKEIDQARAYIFIQAYSFTSALISKALLNAHKRKTNVMVILDKSQRKAKYSSATFMANSKIPTFIDSRHAIAHNKILIIDGTTVITGSFNFTKAAEEKNAENLLVIRNRELAGLYLENWMKHKEHSEKYAREQMMFSER